MGVVQYYLRNVTLYQVLWGAVMAAVCAGLTWRVSRGRRALMALTSTSLALIVFVSLLRFPPELPFSWPWQNWAHGGFARFVGEVGFDPEITLNMLLYFPAGFFVSRYIRRPVVGVSMLAVLSVVVEVLQTVFAVGNADVSDVLSNAVGAACGGVLAWCVMPGTRAARVIVRIFLAALACALVWGGCRWAASSHLRHGQEVLQERFSEMTASDFEHSDRNPKFLASVFSVGGLKSSGNRILPNGVVEVRYSLDYLGARQCAITAWDTSGVAVSTVHGNVCSEFWG